MTAPSGSEFLERDEGQGLEVAEAAARAGSAITEQVAAITEAARSSAEGTERSARESAAASLKDAGATAAQVLEKVDAIERQLTGLLRVVSKEADLLRAAIERGGVAGAAETVSERAHPAIEAESQALAIEGSTGDDQDVEAGAVGDAPPEEAAPPNGDGGAEASAAGERSDDHESSGEGETVLDEAQLRVESKSDIDLAELYEIAQSKLGATGTADEQQIAYWGALADAAVAEAVRRPNFGEPTEDQAKLSRREKKQVAKRLKGLAAAREAAVGDQTSDQ